MNPKVLEVEEEGAEGKGTGDELIRCAFLIRQFEEKLLALFTGGELFGTIHTCIGQEWIGVLAAHALNPQTDTVFSNHRCHGHFLAWTRDPESLMAEIMGKSAGACGGIGGSQHLHAPGFFSNGVLGGMLPVSAGKALADKKNGQGRICAVFMGDGAFGEGVVYETLNIASKWKLPLLVIVENNGIAQSTPQTETLAGSIEDRARAFGMAYGKANTWDWEELAGRLADATDHVRSLAGPFLLEVETYRLRSHSKGDDTRTAEIIFEYEKKDPLNRLLERDPEKWGDVVKNIQEEIDGILARVRKMDSQKPPAGSAPPAPVQAPLRWGKPSFESDRFVHILNQCFRENLMKNPRLIFLGEDIQAPYGGAFKVTKDLSCYFPDRVLNSPVSEAALVGMGAGLALGKFIPVVEIMFGDFLALCFDQLINHACKFQTIYNQAVRVPLIVRTPMGGHRGYGPTHSQSLERHFLGIPNLDVLALNARVSPRKIYDELFQTVDTPTLVIENKVLYTKFLRTEEPAGFEALLSNEKYPTVRLRPVGRTPDLTVVCYGGLLEDVETALLSAFDEYDIVAETICPTRISPLNLSPIAESVRTTGRLLTVEEGGSFAAWSSEVAAQLLEQGIFLRAIKRVACNTFIPTARELEKHVLPDPARITAAMKEIAGA